MPFSGIANAFWYSRSVVDSRVIDWMKDSALHPLAFLWGFKKPHPERVFKTIIYSTWFLLMRHSCMAHSFPFGKSKSRNNIPARYIAGSLPRLAQRMHLALTSMTRPSWKITFPSFVLARAASHSKPVWLACLLAKLALLLTYRSLLGLTSRLSICTLILLKGSDYKCQEHFSWIYLMREFKVGTILSMWHQSNCFIHSPHQSLSFHSLSTSYWIENMHVLLFSKLFISS